MDLHHPQREFAVDVVKRLTAAGFQALWAGGCVRDLLREREPDDFDVATNATPEDVRKLFGRRNSLAVGESFGVVIVLGAGEPRPQIEVATFRTEGPYADGRRPDSVRYATPEEDAQRRDFTINGMFYDPLTDTILDFVGGQQDLQQGILRAIGDPRARMAEDKLRMLRAARFAATLDFELDPDTAAAVQAMAPQIDVVSWERITQELRKMLCHPHRRRAVRLMQQLDLLPKIFPELVPSIEDMDTGEWNHLLDTLDALRSNSFVAAAAVLLRPLPLASKVRARPAMPVGTIPAVCRRMRLSNREREAIVWLVEHRNALTGIELLPAAQLKRLLLHEGIDDLLHIGEAEARARNQEASGVQFVRDYLHRTPLSQINPPPLVTGEHLLQLGLRAGPQFKALLEAVRDAQLEGRVETVDQAMLLVQELRQTRE